MSAPSFLRLSIHRRLANRTLGPSGCQVYPPRWYTRLNGVSWLQFAPVAILTGELVDGYFKVENDGYLLYGDDYVSVASGVITLSANLTGTINGSVIASGVTMVTGGADYFVFTANADTSFSYIGHSTTPFVGTPYDVKFADKRLYKLDEPYSESGIYEDNVNDDGDELWTYGDAIEVGTSPQYATVAGTTSRVIDAARWFKVSFSAEMIQGSLQLLIGNTGIIVNSSTEYSEIYTSQSSGGLRVRVLTTSAIGSITNISVKESTWAKLTNGTSDDVTQELA